MPRNEMEALVNLGADLPMLSVPEEQQVSLKHVLRFWTWADEEIVALIEDVRGGKLLLHGRLADARGIAKWIFDVAQLKAWRLGLQKQLPHWVTVKEVSKALRIHADVTCWLIRSQFIHAERATVTRGVGYRISRRELERFQDAYVFGTELATRMGVSPAKAKSILAGMGFHPVSGSGADQCRQLFYSRTDGLTKALERYHFVDPDGPSPGVGKSRQHENQLDLIRIPDENPLDS